ncbi:hypothetical protein PG984_002729 [Apiospora sp. TS-2023a]
MNKMACEEVMLERERIKSRRRQALLNFKSRCLKTAPHTFPDLLRFAAENTTGFVAIDFDGWGQKRTEVTELGITYVPPAAQLPPQDIYDGGPSKSDKTRQYAFSVARTFLQSHSIRVNGRKRFESRRESYWYKPLKRAEPEDVEDEALKLLRGIRTGSGKPCLVGFSLEYELVILLNTYPRVVEEFSAVIDLQSVAKDLYSMQHRPPLRNTLKSFGMDCLTRRDAKGALCAGNDAVRIALLLAKMLSLPPSYTPSLAAIEYRGPGATREPYLWRLNKEFRFRKFWPKSRPMPKELYPYTAVLVSKGRGGIGIYDFPIPEPESLFAYFEHYRPIASGVDLDHRRNRRPVSQQRGYLSFESLEDLNAFVENIDKEAFDGREWSVHSKYDPSIQPAHSREEYRQNRREGSMAMKEIRQHQRQEMQTEYAEALEEDNGDFFNAMFAL